MADLDPIDPAIESGSFRVTPHDLEFLSIAEVELRRWQNDESPLGIPYPNDLFVKGLETALISDGITDVDVRVRGSSAEFFSGAHKPMPVTRAEWAQCFEKSHWGNPSPEELDRIEAHWNEWILSRQPPERRPFDSLHRLGIERDPSDIDLQISSKRATQIAAEHHSLDPFADTPFIRKPYGFVDDMYAASALQRTFNWADQESRLLRRQVNIKLFDSDGPPRQDGALSSHFQETDWILI